MDWFDIKLRLILNSRLDFFSIKRKMQPPKYDLVFRLSCILKAAK